MRYAIVENGKVVNVVLSDADYAEQQGWVACPDEVSIGWTYDGSSFAFGLPYTADELASQHRQKRNALLAASDWTQVADAPVDKAAWGEYRQALRDITDQPGFPLDIAWPAPPA